MATSEKPFQVHLYPTQNQSTCDYKTNFVRDCHIVRPNKVDNSNNHQAKIWIQRLWTLGLAWDEPPAENLKIEEFKADIRASKFWKNSLLNRFFTDCDPIKHEIHCFTDASIHAYAATVYLVTEKPTGERVSISLQRNRRLPPSRESHYHV